MAALSAIEFRATDADDKNSRVDVRAVLSVDIDDLPIVVRMSREFDDEKFERFSRAHEPLRMEMLPNGDIRIMTPVGCDVARLNAHLTAVLGIWNEARGDGVVFASNVGFRMPDNSILSPDASWMSQAKHDSIPLDMRHKFARVCPEFIIELRSESDRLPALQRKMEKWLDNGVQLAWLIDPKKKQAIIYSPGKPPRTLQAPAELKGEKPVESFVLPMHEFWA